MVRRGDDGPVAYSPGADDGGEMPERECLRTPVDSSFCACEPGVGRMRDRLLVHRRVHTLCGHQILISGDVAAYYSCRVCHPSLDRRKSDDLICAEMSLIEPGERYDQ